MIKIEKSIYDKPEPEDGQRILVMRLWPRGVSKERAKIDSWMKELGTERDLIKKWKGGKVTWQEFEKEYRKSLKDKKEMLKELAARSTEGDITLLCTDKDPARCHRSILADEIRKSLKKS
ncbi:MAG TPA: DUF488 family protein [Nitrososphaerales archaeon]|nr:DUF488 family protein [Nitrososphaerales archaeon]